jgi:hypothetical protein
MAQLAASIEGAPNPLDLLKQLMSDVYGGSLEGLALGLGRPTDEIERWMNGSEQVDEDAEYKIRALGDERLGDR